MVTYFIRKSSALATGFIANLERLSARCRRSGRALLPVLAGTIFVASAGAAHCQPARSLQRPAASAVTRECAAWKVQGGPQSDRTGLKNTNFPEASNSTYWTTQMQGAIGSVATIHGQFPLSRFTALEIYTGDTLVDHVDDVHIVPDPGQNNPYVSGTANGTYTAQLVFGPKPLNPSSNTLYTGSLTAVVLMYRIYHSTDPLDPAGGATDPVLPDLVVNGQPLVTCPVLPFLVKEDVTAWGRLDNGPFIGASPTATTKIPASDPPVWSITDPYSAHFFPNGANYYMSATLSREFLQPNTGKQVYVVRFLAPTYPKTRSGEPVYLDRQVHFWSMCTDDPYTTNVTRCVPDDAALLDGQGYAMFVVSDPGARPTDAALAMFKANWLAWGALLRPGDMVYDRAQRGWGVSSPVHYYNSLLYRQTLANVSFTRSFLTVSELPIEQQEAAMGSYWPIGGYCSTADFETFGFACLGR